jgi:hypothetical protein
MPAHKAAPIELCSASLTLRYVPFVACDYEIEALVKGGHGSGIAVPVFRLMLPEYVNPV